MPRSVINDSRRTIIHPAARQVCNVIIILSRVAKYCSPQDVFCNYFAVIKYLRCGAFVLGAVRTCISHIVQMQPQNELYL
jgi:hypothetical protein